MQCTAASGGQTTARTAASNGGAVVVVGVDRYGWSFVAFAAVVGVGVGMVWL